MEKSRYPIWFLGTVLAALAALVAFNWAAGAYIFALPYGPSVETLSGFERALKPVWLDQAKPDTVFVGSSRVRDAFDPVLVDPAFHIRSFNYGASSIAPYEARRFAQDALAQPSVKRVVVALDAFSGNGGEGEATPSFDETRLAVTPSGAPTPRRALWLFTTRFLSGGALGMNALSLWSLLQIKPGETAANHPRTFEAYSHMTQAVMAHDLAYRRARTFTMGPRAAGELERLLDIACHAKAKVILYFPPDRVEIQARYAAADAAGLAKFKQDVAAMVARHNAACPNRIALYDFLTDNPMTRAPLANGRAADYVDLVHVRPPAGLRLLKQMGF
jgi:hypothetical protein